MVVSAFPQHPRWDAGNGWQHWLNNLRLILLPWVRFNVLKPWLKVFLIPEMKRGFQLLIQLIN